MNRFFLSLSALLIILLSSGLLVAQDTNSDDADNPASAEQISEAEQQQQLEQSEPIEELIEEIDEDSAVADTTEEESSARFIPTEEISQDLGVSFPVDI